VPGHSFLTERTGLWCKKMGSYSRVVSQNIDFTTTGSGQSWTAPAGVTDITIMLGDRTNAANIWIQPVALTVVPGTTYTFTINDLAYGSIGSPNTFGSLFSWKGANRIYLQWVE